jgi:hypothetical protein
MTEDLTAKQTWRGPFWSAGQPERMQRGMLSYDPTSGVILSLVGGFAAQRGSGRFLVIDGRVGSKPVSLLDCRISASRSSGFGGEPDEQELRVGRMLTGVFLTNRPTRAS